jgi:hypothetical protein
MSKRTPFRDATNAAANTAILVFFGSLVLGAVNRALDAAVAKTEATPPQPDLHAVVD